MESTTANFTAATQTESTSWRASFAGRCEDIPRLEKLVAELIFRNQQLRFMLSSAKNRIEVAQAIAIGLYTEPPEHSDVRRLHESLTDESGEGSFLG